MKNLERVTRESVDGQSLLYLSYKSGAALTRTIDATATGSVAIDVDAAGDTVGIELLAPGVDDIETLTRIARERDLSLDGLFSFA